jgi:hypothetical protein
VLVVHDWHEHQYDPRKLDRQREYDERQRAPEPEVSDPVSVGVSDAQSDAVSDGFLTGDSRGGARDRAPNVERERRTEKNESGSSDVEYPAPGVKGTRKVKGFERAGTVATELAERSNGWTQALTVAERDEWSSFGREWDAFRTAWLGRGFRHPPAGSGDDDPDDANPSQRALLWSVLNAWPNDLPRWITEAPKRLSAAGVVGHVIDRWHGKRDEGNERADAQERAAEVAKAEEKIKASEASARIDDDMKAWR